MKRTLPVVALLLGLVKTACPSDCQGLAKLSLPHTTLSLAQAVPPGDFKAPEGPPVRELPEFCRIAGTTKPSADSDIRFEVWLPVSGWNGKFEGVGNGGFAGSISYSGLGAAIKRGYATASTDTGHEAGGTDAAWALGHPEKVIDFGYRAIHETAEKAKAVIAAYYGSGPKRSYFNSCSNGGRQALMEAQRYPADYDGIIAGAPANYWTHLLTGAGWDIVATLAEPGTYIPSAKLKAIEAAALAACDGNDGVKDGVIEDPSRCHFDPGTLLCQGAESDECLTAPQITALKKIYAGPHDSKGKAVFPGYSPGGEAEPGGWGAWITGNGQEKALMYAFRTQFFKNMVYEDAAWDYHTFTVDKDMKAADEKTARMLNATDPDLKRFKDRGGKLILYHGWSDAAIPAENAVEYYNSVVANLGAIEASSFVRLFMVPGMQHCGGGSGPNYFGQFGVATGDPDHDISSDLERWVEQGTAPERIVASKYKNPMGAEGEVLRTRPLCAYPSVARWKGIGSTDAAENFDCVKP